MITSERITASIDSLGYWQATTCQLWYSQETQALSLQSTLQQLQLKASNQLKEPCVEVPRCQQSPVDHTVTMVD